jgi:dTDP-4-amino-4,6-dideoxygalactose transaminase
MIPMFTPEPQHQALRHEIHEAVQQVLNSGRYLMGPNVQGLEEEMAQELGTRHAVACASGTDALHLALLALGIGAGDEVITTPFTFAATAEAICYTGATPVFVDIDAQTFNMDPERIREAITPATRAVIPVHIFGQPAAMEAINTIAKENGLEVIEDCAQAQGATRGGQQTGTMGTLGCFSFFPTKNLGCYGDGGLVSTDSDEMAAILRALRHHGNTEAGNHRILGYNSRLDEIQAAILRVKLPHVATALQGRRAVAQRYQDALAELPGVTPPYQDPAGDHTFNQYTILAEDRDRLRAHLHDQGIASAIHYVQPLNQYPAFRSARLGSQLTNTEWVCRHCMSLPIWPDMPAGTTDTVITAVREASPAA